MSLSSTEAAELLRLSTDRLAESFPAIHHLAALYTRYGSHGAREVTDVIGQGTASWTAGYFSGFIARSNSVGFRRALTDPDISNAQTGHFFSFTMWALDGEEITDFELSAALGHEFVTDGGLLTQADQLLAGVSDVAAFRQLITRQPLDPNGELDYEALDSSFRAHGWTSRIRETEWIERQVPGLPLVSHTEVYTGNSLADLRCTVAGFHFGRLIRSGLFATAADAAAWLVHNVLDGPTRVSIADGGVSILREPAATH